MKPAIIFDLDETLIHSRFITKNKSIETIKSLCNDEYLTAIELHPRYCTFLRPIAFEMLKFSRNLVGKDNVYIATISMGDYATDICTKAFGFKPNKIFAREELCEMGKIRALNNTRNIIVDNTNFTHNYIKTEFFSVPSCRYIQCPDFDPLFYFNQKNDLEFLEKLKNKLNEIINS